MTEAGKYDINLQVDGSFSNNWLPIYMRKNDDIIKELHLTKKDFRMSTSSHVYLGKSLNIGIIGDF